MKTYKAIMHFNKPSSAKGKPWTVHYRGTCYVVAKVICKVSMVSEWKPTRKNNPRAFFTAQASRLTINKNEVVLS